MLDRLERDHARVLVAVLAYGTLTALEEGRITIATSYRALLNYDVLDYFYKAPRPRDRFLVEALWHGVEIDDVYASFGQRAVALTCRQTKAKLAPWWSLHLQTAGPLGRASPGKITLERDIPLDQILVDLDANRSRALITLLLYGALAALEERLIPYDVAERVVLNRRVLQYCKENIRPEHEILENGLARCVDLCPGGGAGGQLDVLHVCAEVRAAIARIIWLVTYFMADPGHGPGGATMPTG